MEFPNWFAPFAEGMFTKHLAPLVGRPGLRFLQIGAFTGDASVWLCKNILTGPGSRLYDVDTWQGSDEHTDLDFHAVEEEYDHKTAGLPIVKARNRSVDWLRLSPRSRWLDFVYIDGDHTAPAVLTDAVLALPLLRHGGILAFDDYMWRSHRGMLHSPAPAVNAVRNIYADQLEELELGPQAWFRVR